MVISIQIFVVAEDRVLRVKPSNIGTSEQVIDTFYGPNPAIGVSDEIIGISISISSSVIFITVKNRGLFAFMLRGTLLWSAGPVLNRFGYLQGCKDLKEDCYFNSAPIVDQCEGSVYVRFSLSLLLLDLHILLKEIFYYLALFNKSTILFYF